MIDSDDEDTQKAVKKTVTQKTAPAKAVQRVIPGATKKIPGMAKQPAIAAAAAPEPEPFAEDPSSAGKVNDRGGKASDRYGHAPRKGTTAGEHRAHARRHNNDITGRGGGKEGSRGGRGPGGWGSPEEEARQAEKDPSVVLAEGEEDGEGNDADEVVEEVPTVFGFEEAMARRNEARANSELFGATKERTVEVDTKLKAFVKEENPQFVGKEVKAVTKAQRSANKAALAASFTVSSAPEFVPRERDNNGGRGAGRGGRGEGRGGRGGRGEGRGRGAPRTSAKLNTDDFPAL